jgi:hypothetical protein
LIDSANRSHSDVWVWVERAATHALRLFTAERAGTIELRRVLVVLNLLQRWGFSKQGTKNSSNGVEDVYIRSMSWAGRGTYKDYPFINSSGRRKHLLGIYPEFHTRLFPDSKLRTESDDLIRNVAHTNSISKVYIGWSQSIARLQPGAGRHGGRLPDQGVVYASSPVCRLVGEFAVRRVVTASPNRLWRLTQVSQSANSKPTSRTETRRTPRRVCPAPALGCLTAADLCPPVEDTKRTIGR